MDKTKLPEKDIQFPQWDNTEEVCHDYEDGEIEKLSVTT